MQNNPKIFLLEQTAVLRQQVAEYLQNYYQVQLEIFDTAERLFKASISHHPNIIILGIDSHSKDFFPKLKPFKNTFLTKLVATVSQREKKYPYALEIADHILYKPFSLQDLDYCLNSLAVSKKAEKDITDTKEIKLEDLDKLDLVERESLDLEYKNTFEKNSTLSMEDVKAELYEDIMVLDTGASKNFNQNTSKIKPQSITDLAQQFNPEVHYEKKNIVDRLSDAGTEKTSNPTESLYNYFQKVASESLSGEPLNEPLGEQQDITFTAKQFAKEPELDSSFKKESGKEQSIQDKINQEQLNPEESDQIAKIDLTKINQTTPKIKTSHTEQPAVATKLKPIARQNPEEDIMSISDFNLGFLNKNN